MDMAATSVSRTASETLFEIELDYESGLSRMTSDEGRPGTYIGSGRGRVRGQRIRGDARWDLRENQGRVACEMFFSGVIETDDGATISFETLGHGRVADPDEAPSRWDVAASVRFGTDDERYAWLARRPASWHGGFDSATYRHRYRVIRA